MSLSNQLFQLFHDISHLDVEISLLVGACLVLIFGLFRVSIFGVKLLVVLVLVFTIFQIAPSNELLFDGMLDSSRLSWSFVRILLLSVIALTIFENRNHQRSSYYFVLLISLLGAVWMMHARHFLLIYLAVEMVSYGAYLMTNFSFNKKSHEAGIKYLLFGGVCSGVMLFGISMIYGVNGHLMLQGVPLDSLFARMGVLFFIAGVLFKISAVPFHTWVPNVYEAAPADATAFFSIVPKLAALVLLKEVVTVWSWIVFPVLIFGVLSILMGTLGAIRQTNIRRLVSYGAIAHTGFLLPFALWDLPEESIVIYASVYAIMNIGIFYAIEQYERGNNFSLEQIKGSGKEKLFLGISITIIMVALIGLPPTIGFTAKWLLFSGMLIEYLNAGDKGVLLYFLVAVFATAVAVYYYLRPSFYLFFMEGDQSSVDAPLRNKVILGLICAGIIAIFIYPHWLSWLY